MVLKNELGLKKPIREPAHEALLSIYYTASCIKKRATGFFRDYGLTDVQFNLMMLLEHQAEQNGGLSQTQLSRMMLVNRANISSLVDRIEKSGLVVRAAAPGDRRYNIVELTPRGRRLLLRVERAYISEIKKVMGALKEPEQKRLIALLDRTRMKLSETKTF